MFPYLQDSELLLGYRFITSGVLKPTDPNKEFVDRIISPSYMYDAEHYPDSMSG